jgi:hypothetical protein
MRSSWLWCALILSAALAALNLLAFEYFLYWRYEWFDVFMHLLGGATIGAFLVGLLGRYRPFLYLAVFFVVVISWEILEYTFGIPRKDNYIFDTALDLLIGFIGTLMTYALARKTLWRG